jgi:hypothetical protein
MLSRRLMPTPRRAARGCALTIICMLALAAAAAGAPANPLTQVRSVYRGVLDAEYFGPSGGVCGRLTASGRAAFTAGGGGTCSAAFAAQRRVLSHKVPGVDDSGYTPAQWRQVVDRVMAALEVTIGGSRASAIGPSGIPGRTRLVRAGGRWLFTTYPPSIES